jgi:DNA-binding response OmpR family regulator
MIVRILLATVRDDIKRQVRFFLKEENIINLVNDAESCFQQAAKFSPHLIIIHEDLPFISSLDILSKIRVDNRYNFIRIIVLTETNDAVFFSECLNNGADDIVSLPVSNAILRNRVMAVLRRTDFNIAKELVFDNLIIAPERYSVKINENEFHFPKKRVSVIISAGFGTR